MHACIHAYIHYTRYIHYVHYMRLHYIHACLHAYITLVTYIMYIAYITWITYIAYICIHACLHAYIRTYVNTFHYIACLCMTVHTVQYITLHYTTLHYINTSIQPYIHTYMHACMHTWPLTWHCSALNCSSTTYIHTTSRYGLLYGDVFLSPAMTKSTQCFIFNHFVGRVSMNSGSGHWIVEVSTWLEGQFSGPLKRPDLDVTLKKTPSGSHLVELNHDQKRKKELV